LTWKTRIVHLKTVQSGETISYGRTYKVKEQMKIATLPVGYGDGYRRDLGNKGSVLVRGEWAPIIGRICMDQCMIDVSHIPNVEVGDEVVLLGQQGEKWIDADEIAKWCHTISYEILTGIGKRVPRVYLEKDDVFSDQ
jgi:alanine racemase